MGHTTSFSYDTNGNLVSVGNPLGNSTSITYNSAGQVISVTDPVGNTTQFAYDSGDLVGVTDPLGRTLNRFVDAAGRLTTITDPLTRVTKYAYNPLNQVLSATDALGKQTSFGYDPNGNLLSVTDANNHLTQYTYDNMDRVQTRKDALLNQECYGTFSGGVCQANGYDGNGNLVQFTDRRGKVAKFNYDGLNRMTFAGFGWTTGTTYESTINYTTYDAGNRLKQVVDSISGTINRGYDGLNRLTSDATPQGTVSYTYDNAGRRASLTVPGQAVVNYTFDNANRLMQIAQGTTTVSFGYDNANRRTTLTLPNGVVTGYSYDGASELAGIAYQNGPTTLGNLTYGYDLDGRRISAGGSYARTGLPLAMSQTGYNANNQLTTWGTASLFYDLNGNMTSSGTDTYNWDARNRMVSTLSGASFQYDPFGRRTSKTIGGTTTTFLYDGANAVQEVIGGTNTASSLSGGVDEVFQRTDSAGARSFLTDALGSTLALTDSTGTAQTSYTFEPFGNTTSSGSTTTNSFAYTGRELDAGNLYFYRARYYNPQLQRFISEDPAGFAGGINLYGYAGASPTTATDPSGLWSTDAHNQIIWNALHPCGVSNHDIWQIQQGSHWVDQDFQDPAHSYMHSMSDGIAHQAAEAALIQRDQYIASSMIVAANQLQAGSSDQALFTFGAAMHPLMDMTSPAHTDANGNPIPWCGLFTGCSRSFEHGGDSDGPGNPWSIENVAHLNADPYVQELESALIRARYQALTGRGCKCN